jgi:hypothetical protein
MRPTTLTRIAGAAAVALGMTAAAQTRSNAPRPNPPGQTPSTQPGNNQPGTRPNTQPGNQPGNNQPNSNPQNQPGSPANNNPALSNPNQTNPNQVVRPGDRDPNRPGVQTNDPNAANNSLLNRRQRLFRLTDDTNLGQLNDFGMRMQRFETQMQQSNERLLKQLGQARQLSGPRREDALAEVLQGILQDQQMMQQMLLDMRMSITGDLSAGGTMAGAPSGDNIFDNNNNGNTNTGGTSQPGGSQQPRPSGPPK